MRLAAGFRGRDNGNIDRPVHDCRDWIDVDVQWVVNVSISQLEFTLYYDSGDNGPDGNYGPHEFD